MPNKGPDFLGGVEHDALSQVLAEINMKILRSVVLVSCLVFGGSVGAQQAKAPAAKEYDAGVCGTQDFVALHITVSDKAVTVVEFSTGPHVVKKLDDPLVYKFDKKDAEGSHYVFVKDKDKFELVFKQDEKGIEGLMYVNGEKGAKFYGLVADGSKFEENSFVLFQMCEQIWDGAVSQQQ